MKALFLWLLILLPTGCVRHQVEAPQLTSLAEHLKDFQVPKTCPRLDMPAIPDDVELVIKGDTVVSRNTGGRELLLYYVRARNLLRGLQPSP